MNKLNVTKERFEKSRYFKRKYGTLKYISESGKTYKTDKGKIIRFVTEAREYIDDDSIDEDTAEEFIIFEDPKIFEQIANVQKKEEKKVEKEIEQKDLTKQEIQQDVQQAAYNGPGIGTAIASTAIAGAGNIITNPTVLTMMAGAYGINKAQDSVKELVDGYQNLRRVQKSNAASQKLLQKHIDKFAAQGIDYHEIDKGFNFMDNLSDEELDKYGDDVIHNMDYHRLVAKNLPEKERDSYLRSAQNLCDKYGGGAVAGAAGGATAAGAGTASAAGTATASGTAGTTIFGMSLATIGWIAAGVAAAAIITPYIYDKVRACTKTWLADIIAEVKFKADGKAYRCFYDLKENKWVLTYADIKWTSYMDNKLDKETIDEFFASNFFKKFLDKCRQTFALLFSTGRNEVVFKTLPEIKDAPKELKDILEKIYDNKGAITKNLFTGNHM